MSKDKDDQNPPPRARQQGDAFTDDDDPLQQFEEIEKAQRKIRQKKRKGLIDSIEKSRQREKNKLNGIKDRGDLDSLRMVVWNMNPTTAEADQQFRNAAALVDAGNYSAAIQALEALRGSSPPSPAVCAKLAQAHWELGQLETAEQYFRDAMELAPKSDVVSLGLFHVLWDQEKQSEAFAEAKRFLALSDSEAYRTLIADMRQELAELEG